MTYQEVLDFLFSQLPMYQRQGKSAFKKDLTNIIALCNHFDNPQNKFKSIHLAGTNGKGSTSHIIAAGLQAHDLKVGVYTSPHYKDYRERIKINGTLISEEAVISFVVRNKDVIEAIKPSFFEMSVAMAFEYFADQKVDVAIIETGLGGRLDSTNIIMPICSVITNISMDHMNMLGDTLELIAGEKAGIIKSAVPVIIGETQEEIKHVFEQKAQLESAMLSFADQNTKITESNNHWQYRMDEGWKFDFEFPMMNSFQQKNLVTGLFTLFQLRMIFSLDVEKIKYGIENLSELTYYIGRWMIKQNEPLVILDSAHNDAGVRMLIEEIDKRSYDKLHIVWGAASDKDVKKIFSLLPKEANYYWVKADIPRGMPTAQLSDIARTSGLHGYEYADVQSGFNVAVASANYNDIVLVAGSIFVVAEVI